MALIKGSELSLVQRLLGLAGRQVAGITDIDTENVQQVLPIAPEVLRRSAPIAPGGGFFQGVLENVHSAADDETSFINPYIPGVGAGPGFPSPVPDGWDIWLIGVGMIRSSGAGGLTSGFVGMNTSFIGWGIDDAGAAVTDTPEFTLARFDAIDATNPAASPEDPGITEQGETFVSVNLRVPRLGTIITFRTEAAAAATFQASLIMGLFPEGMGQDVAG